MVGYGHTDRAYTIFVYVNQMEVPMNKTQASAFICAVIAFTTLTQTIMYAGNLEQIPASLAAGHAALERQKPAKSSSNSTLTEQPKINLLALGLGILGSSPITGFPLISRALALPTAYIATALASKLSPDIAQVCTKQLPVRLPQGLIRATQTLDRMANKVANSDPLELANNACISIYNTGANTLSTLYNSPKTRNTVIGCATLGAAYYAIPYYVPVLKYILKNTPAIILNAASTAATLGATVATINWLTPVTETHTCSICQETKSAAECTRFMHVTNGGITEQARTKDQQHWFCTNCLVRHFTETQNSQNTCPNCRQQAQNTWHKNFMQAHKHDNQAQ